MRVAGKEIKDIGIIVDLLNSAHVGRLGTVGKEGYPVIKPLNFVYYGNAVYFHGASQGEKIDDIERDPRVCFEVDQPIAYARRAGDPCGTDYLYRSVIIAGRAALVADEEEKVRALGMLMKKYEPLRAQEKFPENKVAITAVVRIDIESITGKEDIGSGKMRETVLKALEAGSSLPLVLEK